MRWHNLTNSNFNLNGGRKVPVRHLKTIMRYFIDIRSFAQLKKEYRRLALENHPDRGGDTAVMQQINLEFERLFEQLKDCPIYSARPTGYETDYEEATAGQYAEYVYNEYRFTGSNYKGQRPPEVVEIIRRWLKETYPRCKFSVTRKHYDSIYVYLVSADFEPFVDGSEYIKKQINQYHIEKDEQLTDRAKEVLKNICDHINSYNFDDSDAMTDYFHCNFYLTMGIGTYDKPFKKVTPKLVACKGDEPDTFRHPEGEAHKAIRRALSGSRFSMFESRRHGQIVVLGEDHYGDKGEHYFWPKSYSSAKTAQKRIDKLAAAGIISKLAGYNSGYIRFVGYTPETESALEKERQEYADAYGKWQRKHFISGGCDSQPQPNQ